MPAFDSGSVVEPLDYSFEKHIPGCKGTVQEPTDKQIAKYLADVKKMSAEMKASLPEGIDADDPMELLAAMETLDTDIVLKMHDTLAGIYASLCSGEPSKATLLKLPARIRVMFYAWLQQEVMAPEAAPGGGMASVKQLRPAAAG
jgi:hypothetical protein